jgi:N-acetylmuramoyl-L-alanine amidase
MKIPATVLAAAVLLSLYSDQALSASPDKKDAMTYAGVTDSPKNVVHMRALDRAQLEYDLTNEAQRIVDRLPPLDGQASNNHKVSVRFDGKGEMLIVDLGRGFIPEINGAQFEDNLHEVSTLLLTLLEGEVPVAGVRFIFSGKDRYEYFPEDKRETPPQISPSTKSSALSLPTAVAPKVMISAGHGSYYHYGYKDWRYQRDEYNGVLEDLITPPMAELLSSALISRSGATTSFVRSRESTIHEPSGLEWWKVSSRYHLASKYPDLTSVWNSKASSPRTGDIERTEDLYARPLFANNQNVDTLLQIHTNGVADTTARGLRLIHQPGRVEDRKLAESALCYMKEVIHATPGYESYPIGGVHEDDNAETREAHMSTVIAEVGFHTNPEDQAALKDPNFQKAAMLGFEKGYRMYRLGKTCEPFAITSTPDIKAPSISSFNIVSNFTGNPTFPVTRTSKATSCPSGITCTGSTQKLTAATDNSFVTKGTCTARDPMPRFTIGWAVTFIDADGVTSSTTFSVECGGA